MAEWSVLIRSYRKENGLKQDALAYLLGVDQTTISRWEREIDTPSVALQKRLRDLFWKREDSVIDGAVRMIRSSPARASLVVPGTKIIEISEAQAVFFHSSSGDMRGCLMRDFYGQDYYEQYMLPLAELGIYTGEVTRIDLITQVNRAEEDEKYSHTSITPLCSSSGVYAVSQSQFISSAIAKSQPSRMVYRFDELVE